MNHPMEHINITNDNSNQYNLLSNPQDHYIQIINDNDTIPSNFKPQSLINNEENKSILEQTPEYPFTLMRPAISYEDFENLSGGQIYDVFFEKGKNLGHFANRIIRRLNEAKYINTGSTLERKKNAKLEQREHFQRLDDEGINYLRSLIKTELNDTKYIQKLQPADDLKIRVSHLIYDTNACCILNQIYPRFGIDNQSHHQKLSLSNNSASNSSTINNYNSSNNNNSTNNNYNSSNNNSIHSNDFIDEEVKKTPVIIPNLWSTLAKEYFNNASWSPMNALNHDSKVRYFNPSVPPSTPYTGPQLRLLFMNLRSQYSLAYALYQERQLAGDLSIEFGEGDKVLLYLHLLYGSMSTFLPCMRDSSTSATTESQSIKYPRIDTSTSNLIQSTPAINYQHFNNNNHISNCTDHDQYLSTSISNHSTHSSVVLPSTTIIDDTEHHSKHAAIEEYYRQATRYSKMLSRHKEIEFLRNQLKEEPPLSDHIKRAVEEKLNTLLLE